MKQNEQGKKMVVAEIMRRFYAMETYGKSTEALGIITQTLIADLEVYPAELVLKAFKTHAQKSAKFPTTADLIGLIKHNGRPAIKESDIIHIRKKDGAERSLEEWELLKAWELQQYEQWDTSAKQEYLQNEVIRLRKQVQVLREENLKAWNMLKVTREVESKPFATENSKEKKIAKTVEYLKSIGAPQSEIDAFYSSLN